MKLSEIGRITDLTRPLNVGVAGTSALKLDATKSAISQLGLLAVVSSIPIGDTDIDEQPVGILEIWRGAEARARLASEADLGQDIYIGIENGIDQDEDESWQDFAMIFATFNNRENRVLGCTEKCVFPTDAVLATQQLPGGFKENTVGKYMESQGIVKKHDDPHIDLCCFSRRELLENGILEVLWQIFPKMR